MGKEKLSRVGNPERSAFFVLAATLGIVSTVLGDNWNTGTTGAIWTNPGTKVGIGVAPGWPLQVTGGVGVYGPGGDFTALQLRAGSGNGDITRLSFAGDGEGQYAQIVGQVLGEVSDGNTANAGKLVFRTRSGGTGSVGDMADRMVIDPGGNVGIGTTSPSGKLEAVSSSSTDGYAIVANSSQAYKQFLVKASGSGNGANPLIKFSGGYMGGTNGAEIYQTTEGTVRINIHGSKNGLTILPSGEVGLGRDPAAGKMLDVGGDVAISGNVTVAGITTKTWTVAPDYVFEKEYRLRSLDEVDSFVKKNKHLPEVPSAKDFKEKGMDLAEMNFILLKKVEELTLHAIRQEKEMKSRTRALERELAIQGEEIRQLKSNQ